ncbi:MAG: PAS domain S-box protein [Leptolyngbyaceae cyanobacterium bins.302]|nr:PAS domain S-box protein [Leptolyngbyaceae cyanobacterium bins.302]
MQRWYAWQMNMGLGATLLLLLVNAIVSYRNILHLYEISQAVAQSNQTLKMLEQTLSTLKDAETGQRGYLLTGKEKYLEPYKAAIAQIGQQVQELQQNPKVIQAHSQQMQAIKKAIAAKQAELEETIQLRRTQGLDAALKIVQTDRGRQLMRQVRQTIAEIQTQENQRLAQQQQASQTSLNITLITFTLVSGASLLLLGLISWMHTRSEMERQVAEIRLRESEHLFKTTFNQAAVGIAHVNLDGSWQRVNRKLCEIVGYNQEELLTKTFQEITYAEDLDVDLSYVNKLLAGEIKTYVLEKRYIHKNGSLIWVDLTVALLRDVNGQPKFFISVIQDISDRKQIELSLRQSEEHLRQVLQDMPVMLDAFDGSGNIIVWNQECERVTGFLASEVIQNSAIMEALYPETTYRQKMLVAWAEQGNNYRNWEWDITCKDGSTRTVAWSNISELFPIPGWVSWGIGVDVTDRKQAEQSLRQLNATLEQRVAERTAQLEEINQELEAFTYSVSHDLRAPLRVMQGFAQALQEDYGDLLDEMAHTYMQSIHESAVQMDNLINDLLQYSRLTRTQIHLFPTDLNEIVPTALQQLTNQIQAYAANITVAPNLPTVLAHRTTLIQIVMNLISNALKFVEPGIQPQIAIEFFLDANWAYLSIRDNGIGIAPEHQSRIFRVFERLHGVEAYSGTGIGLAIVDKGIERMGGRVGVESWLGQGSRFWIALPLVDSV